jgi:hypothetical protein
MTASSSPTTGRSPVIPILIAAAVVFVVLVGISAANENDDPSLPEVCATLALLQSDVVDGIALADDESVTVEELRDATDRILVDLVALDEATDNRYGTQMQQLRDAALDLRRSLADLEEGTSADVARELIADTRDDVRVPYQVLVDVVEPTCLERE